VPRLAIRMEIHELAFSWFLHFDDVSSRLGVLHRALEELHSSQGRLEAILTLVLAVGNFLNAGTKFGRAMAVKLDTLNKLATLKCSEGNLLNFVALWASTEKVELLGVSEHWIAVWAAAELSFKQVMCFFGSHRSFLFDFACVHVLHQVHQDVVQLEHQLIKAESEQARLINSETVPGLDHKQEHPSGRCSAPLLSRLSAFLKHAQPNLVELKTSLGDSTAALQLTMSRFGENLHAPGDDDNARKFFGVLVMFARNFQAAHDQNLRKQQASLRAARLAAEATSKLEKKRIAALKLEKVTPANLAERSLQEHIFDKFYRQDDQSSEQVMEKFRQKLVKR
jgi:hypothetical protein